VLSGDAYTEEVRADERAATELGINGVPFFVLDRRYGVSGAQSPDILLQALEQAWADSHPSLVLTPVGAGAGDAACTERHLRDVTACVRCRATAHVEKADDVRMATDPHRFLSTGEQRWAETLEHQLANLFPALLRSGRQPAQAAGMGGASA
jgi:hypothetical protein